MRNLLMVLAVLVLASISFGQEEILQYYDEGEGIFAQGSQYCNGYSGVWYDVTQFDANATGFLITEVEYWFYEAYPWEESTFDSEIFDADISTYNPEDPEDYPSVIIPFLAREYNLIAQHYSPTYHTFSQPLTVDTDFWCFVHITNIYGGPTCAVGNVEPQFSHSFKGNTIYNLNVLNHEFWFRVHGEFIYSAEMTSTTWGSIKSSF